MFLPEGEYHELGLLFMYYLLKSRGANVVYLGANIPIADVGFVVDMKKPDYLYLHLTTAGHSFNFEKFLFSLTKRFGTLPIIVSGNLTTSYQKKIAPPVNFKRSFTEVMEFVDSLN